MRTLILCSLSLLSFAGCAASPTVTECPPSITVPEYDGSNADSAWFDTAEQMTTDYAAGLVGMSEEAALRCAVDTGLLWRVVARDGEYFAVTADYSPTRINAVVVDGVVTEVLAG